MTWFQRYGFAGAYFWGLLILWLAAFYNCELQHILTGDAAKIVGAIAAASFLPIGYFSSILQQNFYLKWRWPPLAITPRAMKKANVFSSDSIKKQYYILEAEACLVVMGEKINNNNVQDNKKPDPDVDKQRFLQDWIRNRNNVMAINGSLMIASVLAFIIAVSVPYPLLKWEMQFELRWFLFAFFVTVFVFLILLFSWYILSEEVVRVEAGIYKMLAGLPASELVLKEKCSMEDAQDEK